MDFEISVTICSWNTKEDTLLCLENLNLARKEANLEVIIIDNGSQDGTPNAIRKEFPLNQNPWLNLIESSENLGFTGGHNRCLKVRRAKDALLLNSDAFVHKGAIRSLIDFAANNPESGIIGPKLLNPDGSLQMSCRTFPNPVAALFRSTFIGKLFPKNRYSQKYLMSDWDHLSTRNVDWVSGAAFYVKGEVIDQVGTFDEKYFMYCEDVDWCYRAGKSGFKVTYYPESVVTHKIGASSSQVANKMIIRFHRSMLRFYRKNMIVELPALVRPGAVAFAFCALTVRASLFICKNLLDGFVNLFRAARSQNANQDDAKEVQS